MDVINDIAQAVPESGSLGDLVCVALLLLIQRGIFERLRWLAQGE